MMYGKDKDMSDMIGNLAKKKASKKMSKTAKVGKMMDKKDMMDAKRTPFLTKIMKKGSK
jgi:hypothetical protein